MLPTKGYFQDIECPYYENVCGRPYCHFRHRRKAQEPTEEVAGETTKELDIPTYKPTPKSELANIKSHIPISYVPDLAFRPDRDRTIRPLPKFSFEKPTYKPTPLSILSSANKKENGLESDEKEEVEHFEAIREIKLNIANAEYNPEVSLQEDINFEDLSAEFDLIDDIIQDPNDKNLDIACLKDKEVPKVQKSIKSNDRSEKPLRVAKSNQEEDKHNRSKEKLLKEKSDKHSSSSKSHKSKHHKKDTKDKLTENNKDKHNKHVKRDKRSDRSSDRSKEKSKSSDHKSSHKSNKDKSKSRDRDKSKSSSSRSKDRHKDKQDKSRQTKSDDISEKTTTKSELSSDENNSFEVNNFDDYPDSDDEDTYNECYRIFSEYEAPQAKVREPSPSEPIREESEDQIFSKKRVAHASAQGNETFSRINHVKPKPQINCAQVMANRFKLAKLAQASNEQKNVMNEVKQHVAIKRPAPSLLEAARRYKSLKIAAKEKAPESVNIVDRILSSSKTKPTRIAPVSNVNSIQRAKERIAQLAKQRAAEALNKTPAQIVKGAKRVAHVPDISLSDIPDVLNADKSKLPINVRTRFLTMIAEECAKLYLIKEEAYNRALNEEFSCYEKCKVLITYKNSAMLAVSRVRKELQERERLGLGLIGDGEPSHKDTTSDFRGRRFYDHIKRYVLTDEELDIHGYPKESSIPGRAVIKNRKTKADVTLGENQRKCTRCSKIYLVDDDGFVLYPEECLYHPLKKRTLRGEQTYLCCKTNDGLGCVTSTTHVSEVIGDCELEGFQTTMRPESDEDPRNHAVYALDCEMCYTIKGLELTRVTIVDSDCKTVYESLVKPLNPIIDYNTTFSGITREQMERTSTSILQVQANILHLCNSRTILIGHSLESDMKALKIIHGTIVDTSVLFPHKMGLPHKRALKMLASDYLKKIIQNNVNGHDSAEDAIACMDLVKWKLKEELKVKGVKF